MKKPEKETSVGSKERDDIVNEQEQKVIAYLLETYADFTSDRSTKLSIFFTGLRNFMSVAPEELRNFNYVGTRTKQLNETEIQRIIDVRGKGLINLNETGEENFISLVIRRFIIKQVEKIRNINLENLKPNPFLIRSLALDSPGKMLRFNVYAFIARSIVTSFGNDLETILAGSSNNIKKLSGNYWDLEKTDGDGTKHYIQVKSGPNDMNTSAVTEWENKLDAVEKRGAKGYIGFGYGDREKSGISLGHLKSFMEKSPEKVLIGKELWDFVSEDSNLYGEVLDTMREQALTILEKQGILEELEIAITKVEEEFIIKYGTGGKGVDNYIADVY